MLMHLSSGALSFVILVHLFTCHTTQALIKYPLFLIAFDLIYPTFIFHLYYLFFKKLDKW
jgi:hypothetical protein